MSDWMSSSQMSHTCDPLDVLCDSLLPSAASVVTIALSGWTPRIEPSTRPKNRHK